jgi:radical SAM superfamily enzyme YgiQ (UPF0313 family)
VRVLLISANTERIKMPTLPLGLALVAAAVRKAGHETVFLDLLNEADPQSAIDNTLRAFAPEVVGISVRNIDDQSMETQQFLLERVRDVVSACRASCSAPVVLGGAGYSIFPEAALEYLGADFGVCGEGERAFPALLHAIDRGSEPSGIAGLYVAGRGRQAAPDVEPELDRLPLPLDDLWSSADAGDADLWVPVQTRRGCPMDCTYCSTAAIEGRTVRFRSPDRVARHVAEVAAAGFRRIYFVDNTFNRPPSYALDLCRAIAAVRPRVAWRCILYPRNVPEALVRAMAEAGCVEVSFGFESGSKQVLRAMNKRFQPDEARAISDRLVAHGIRRLGFLLLGGPGETRQTVDESLDFADSLRLEMLHTTIGIRIYPHTPLARQAVAEGMIAPDDDLLRPRFYLQPDLQTCIHEMVESRGK